MSDGREALNSRPLPAPRSVGVQGAAVYSMLNTPEPIAAADTSFDGRITRAEFSAVIDQRFIVLDKAGMGYLTLDTLPRTPLQVEIIKRDKQAKAHPQRSEGPDGESPKPESSTPP